MSVIDFNQRPILDLSVVCFQIPAIPQPLCFTMPGGLELCVMRRPNVGLLAYASDAIAQINTALTPLQPIFNIVDIVLSILKVFQAVPGVISNPAKLAEEISKLAEKVTQIAKYIPPFSILFLLVNMIDTFIAFVQGLQAELVGIGRLNARIQEAQFAQENAPGLDAIIRCAQAQATQQLQNLEAIFGSINGILTIINFIGAFTKLDVFPIGLDLAPGTQPAEIELNAKFLDALLELLRGARNKIPVPIGG